MWASLTAIFVVLLVVIVSTVVWIGANVIAFLQPILIPVAIAAILAYLLDPVVNYLARRGFGRTKAVLSIFLIIFLAIAALVAWIVPTISVQSASLARQLPYLYHARARQRGRSDVSLRTHLRPGWKGGQKRRHHRSGKLASRRANARSEHAFAQADFQDQSTIARVTGKSFSRRRPS